MTERARRLPYDPALDGLRAVAVIAVLVFHGGFTWARGGFLGVSVFFTLSGFLITTLLVAEHGSDGHISLAAFWGRRARRLLPAALACVLLVAVLDRVNGIVHRAATRGDLLASVANVANWRFYVTGQSYGAVFAAPSPVQHFWSLAIEEQFYVALPLAVWFVLQRRGWSLARLATFVAIAFAALSALAAFVGRNDADLAYYATFARAPELLAGTLLALGLSLARARGGAPRRGHRSARAVAVAAAAAIGVVALAALVALTALADQPQRWLYLGGLPAFSVVSVGLIVGARGRGPLRSLLSLRPLVWIGQLSYGIYLFHWPLFGWLSERRVGLSGGSLFAVRLAATLAVSALSYTLLERPVRTGRLVRGPGAWIAAPTAAALVAAAVVPLTGSLVTVGTASARVITTRPVGFDSAASSSFALAPALARAGDPAIDANAAAQPSADDDATPNAGAASSTSPASASASAELNAAATGTAGPLATASGSDASALAPRRAPARVLVVGDSTANALAPGLVQWGQDTALADVDVSAIRIGCGFVTTGRDKFGAKPRDIGPICGQVQRQLADAAAVSNADVALVVDGIWEVTDHQAPGDSWRAIGDPVYDAILAAAITSVTARLLEHVPVVVWATSPRIHPGWGFAGEDPAWDPVRMDRFNDLLAKTVALLGPRVVVVDYARWLNEQPAGLDAGFRPDGVHVSSDAARTVANWLGPQLVALAPPG